MTSKWIILLVIAQLTMRVTCIYHCTMKSFDATCTGINADQIPQDVTVILNKTDILNLNITNGIISTIASTTFQDFINLESLHVTNSRVANLEDNAFSFSLNLQDLSLNKNALTEFNSRSLSPENGLRTLDLSYNLLNDLSDFNISYFPKLNVLNLASNLLAYLPGSLLKTLEAKNEFYLVVDNNPWNCTDPHWSEYLTDKLINAFCTNKTFDIYVPIREDLMIENTDENVTNTERPEEIVCEKPSCSKCSFYYCLFWFFCGIWIGIIFGNIGKIRNLLCVSPVTYTDEYTQCEYSLAEQHMISGVLDTKTHKLTPVSTFGLSVENKKKHESSTMMPPEQ